MSDQPKEKTTEFSKAMKCLIIDDHDGLRSILFEWLKGMFPIVDFYQANSGEQAIQLAESLRPDIFLMDISLPGISGIEATRKIKNFLPDSFIIIHSIHGEQSYRDDAHNAGADLYITKSKTQSDLIPALLKVISSTGSREYMEREG